MVFISQVMKSKNSQLKQGLTFIENKVRSRFEGEGSGHDWWHIHRVRNMALKIADSEPVDKLIVELGALLHDVADHKLFGGDIAYGLNLGREWMQEAGFSEKVIAEVTEIMAKISFKGSGIEDELLSVEGCVVRDADRLDAMGAVGIARTFAFGGNRNRLMYDPEVLPEAHLDFEAYKSSTAPTINHFYEKLLLLKDRMHTRTGRNIAEERHDYMVQYLNQFFAEWEGER